MNISRIDILSLDIKSIKNSLNSKSNTRLSVSSKKADSPPFDHNTIKPWIARSSPQFLVSRNKIGEELLKHCRTGFLLDDPNLYRTRFFVDYHRLHDPALIRYYNSVPVKNRLRKLNLLNESDDAICTNQEFVEYLRYLDDLRKMQLVEARKSEV